MRRRYGGISAGTVCMAALEELRAAAREALLSERFLHTLGTEREAWTLALRYNACVEDARGAALLHDLTKHLNVREQLKICERHGIILRPWEKEIPSLLHGITAAARAAVEFGLSGEAVSAIRWHTTGRAGMTVLEKILYIADMTEPFRHPSSGLARLRTQAYENLDAAFLCALRETLCRLRGKGLAIGPDTLEAYENQMRIEAMQNCHRNRGVT